MREVKERVVVGLSKEEVRVKVQVGVVVGLLSTAPKVAVLLTWACSTGKSL